MVTSYRRPKQELSAAISDTSNFKMRTHLIRLTGWQPRPPMTLQSLMMNVSTGRSAMSHRYIKTEQEKIRKKKEKKIAAASAAHLTVFLYLCRSGSNAQSRSRTLEGLFELTRCPSRALDSPCILLPDLQRFNDTIRWLH